MKPAFTFSISKFAVCVFSLFLVWCTPGYGDVKKSAADGFSIVISMETTADAASAYQALVRDFSKWWDAAHSYSGKSENLSLDLERRCMFEQLANGGFVRHMEITYAEPGKALRMTGGLGPLQDMGVHGALQFTFVPDEDSTNVVLTYNVSGSSINSLDKIAPAVHRVLKDQLSRLVKHCDSK